MNSFQYIYFLNGTKDLVIVGAHEKTTKSLAAQHLLPREENTSRVWDKLNHGRPVMLMQLRKDLSI